MIPHKEEEGASEVVVVEAAAEVVEAIVANAQELIMEGEIATQEETTEVGSLEA